MSSPRQIKAHAKINLFLNLLGPRPDGFHEVRFVMQELALADTLAITPLGDGLSLALTCSIPALETSDNLVVKAYHQFYASVGLPPKALQVHLTKIIPVQAGLGGGSSDAAAMLKTLNDLHDAPLDHAALSGIAAQLGSDVPFFLTGGTALATGRGEIITPLPALPSQDIVLIKAYSFGISTALAYDLMRMADTYHAQDFVLWEQYLQHPDPAPERLAELLYNDFETILFPRYRQLLHARETMIRLGVSGVLLSGSGPTLFGLLSEGEPQWKALQAAFPPEDWFVSRTQFKI